MERDNILFIFLGFILLCYFFYLMKERDETKKPCKKCGSDCYPKSTYMSRISDFDSNSHLHIVYKCDNCDEKFVMLKRNT